MTNDIPAELRAILNHQNGVVTRAQALAAGLTDSAIKVRLGSGRWRRIHLGVYASFSGQPDRAARFWAAVLRAGPGAALSHQTAGELQGLVADVPLLIHVSVPSGSRVARPQGVVVHYSQRLGQARHPVLEPPRTQIEETVLDLAQCAASADAAVGWVFAACGSRRTTPDHIAAAMSRRPRIRWRSALSMAVGLGEEGVHSLLEFRYVNDVERAHGLPTGRRQRAVMRGGRRQYQDVEYEAFHVVVELDGRAAHPEGTRWADVRRDNANAAVGQITLRYGWPDVTERRCLTAHEVGSTLHKRGWEGALRRCGLACQLPG